MLETTTFPFAASSEETLLEAAQRVDWRFLLPNPQLGRVAFGGKDDERLLASLSLFCVALTIVSPGEPPSSSHDVAVTNDPTFARLSHLVEYLRPGGWLYLESRRTKLGDFRFSPRNQVAVLESLGMENIEAHWHWPNFKSCTEIIPLDKDDAVRHFLVKHQGGKVARAKSKVGVGLWRTGALAWVVPCFSLLARKKSER